MRLTSGWCASVLLWAALCAVPWPALAQTAPPAPATLSSSWKQLSAHNRQALAPLAEHWGEISEIQRSKWLAIARNFDQLPSADQQLMQTRMREWAALSPVQRNQARLNFSTLQSLPRDERKSRWDEYQNLSETEKRKLHAATLSPAKTAAPSAKPAGAERLVQPTVRTVPAAALPARTPIDRKTLLPMPTTPAASRPAVMPPSVVPTEAIAPLELEDEATSEPAREASAP